jgi:Cu/Zn superoxide dismutase
MRIPHLRHRLHGLIFAFAAGALACGHSSSEAGRVAVAAVKPTPDHRAAGTVRFESLPEGGTRVVADLNGLEPGSHAMHVHQVGDCSERAAAAGERIACGVIEAADDTVVSAGF